jgi:hypothetical protein
MSHIDQLVEQHIRESESHLKHIDELMEKAREARKRSQLPSDPDLAQLEHNQMRMAQELHGLRNEPRPVSEEVAERSKGLKGMLQSVGAELEKALVAVVDQNKH